MIQVKICGIKDPETAFSAVQLGADYIGIVMHPESKRFVDINTAKAIAKQVKAANAIPVLVCVDQTAEEILALCDACDIHIVQLHGKRSRSQLNKLPTSLRKIYVCHIDERGMIANPPPPQLSKEHDFILFDGMLGGSGIPINTKNITTIADGYQYFIAGGVNQDNVSNIIQTNSPCAIDISSGVEDVNGDKCLHKIKSVLKLTKDKTRFGAYGGIYMPEVLMAAMHQLAECYEYHKLDVQFNAELNQLLDSYAGRETPLTEVSNFSKAVGGPCLLLKREDLLHTGAHKINNALGQCLLAKYMQKQRIIAETGAGQHGVATAAACARLGLACVIYMGAKDIKRQRPNVEKMRLLGAQVVAVETGSQTLKDAVNAALRDYASSFESTHYCLGSALGPYPYPEMVAYFQTAIGRETKQQCQLLQGRLPDMIIACIGGGSNAIGMFTDFIQHNTVHLVGVEAGGIGDRIGEHAARFKDGKPGVLHGCYSYLLQDDNGQVQDTCSISAGLDYPMIGPQHAALFDRGRVKYTSVNNQQALDAFKLLSRTEGIIPALESSHALAYYIQEAKNFDPNAIIVINLSGRGDKDLPQLLEQELV